MYEIEMHKPTEEFARCWRSAGRHLSNIAEYPVQGWLKDDLVPPFLEHMSFRLGNQLFFVRLVGAENYLEVPGNPTGVMNIAEGCNGHACIMPMRQSGVGWVVDAPGWGLIDAKTGDPIDPVMLVTDEKIEMTEWEIQDLGVQVVRTYVVDQLNYHLMSSQGNPDVDPSIWFVGDDGPEWVVVRAVRSPEMEAPIPENIQDIARSCTHISDIGHFASVSIANSEAFESDYENSEAPPPYRGHELNITFGGLRNIHG
jgi:hypothetical protein